MTMTTTTRTDNDTALAELQRTAAPALDGRWAVLHAGRVHGVFDTLLQAGWFANEHFPAGGVAIRQLRVPSARR